MLNNAFLIHLSNEIRQKIQPDFVFEDAGQIFGGDINQSWEITGKKKSYFLKTNQGKPEDFFEKEAEGLRLLAAAKHSLTIPTPLLTGNFDGKLYLLMEWLEVTAPQKGFFDKLGRGLALLHHNSNAFFGLESNNFLGSRRQDNAPMNDWPAFYAEKRILPQAALALKNGYFNSADMAQTERLCQRFPEIFPPEEPALLHGDLWNGNFACTGNNQPSLFDPAVYYGSREIDIAMTLLFGGFDREFYAAYNDIFPLPKDWQTRIGVCQLYPLLMHLNHFGRGYYARVKEVIKA